MGKKFSDEELYTLEKFASNIKMDIKTFEESTSYIKMTDEQLIIHEQAMDILRKKLNLMITADNKKELKKVIRLKKILGDSDEV